MLTTAEQLTKVIEEAKPRLLALTDARTSSKPIPDKWSIREILGHCIDSASNNLQRIVRMQELADIGTFRYTQEHWVRAQHYGDESWADLVNHWYYLNKHLSHVIAHIDPATLDNVCDMGNPKPATLRYVAQDYLRHLRHHMDQIFNDADPRERSKWKSSQ
jgi:hypothetical protein